MSISLALAFQPDILGALSQFQAFDVTLEKHLATATESSAGVVADSGVSFMHFMNPNGVLEESIEVRMQDAYNAFIGSPVAYSQRRELGFSGMTDSLGRYYPLDPGGFFMTQAIEDETTLQQVAEKYIEAIYKAWNELVGSLPKGTHVMVGTI